MDKLLIINRIKEVKNISSDKELADFLGITTQSLSNWKSRNSIDYDLIFTKCVDINPTWLLTGVGSKIIDDTVNKSVPGLKGIPFIPISTFAGYGSGSVSIMQHEVEQYYVVPGLDNADFMIKVDGTSMQPNYQQNDIVACKVVQDLHHLMWDKVYVLHHKERGAIVKRLFPSDKEDYYRCHSDNPKYPPFDIKINEVTNIALVIGLIRIELSDII